MAFASLEDVNRILKYKTGDDPERDADLQARLEAVSDLVGEKLRDFGKSGRQVATYYDIPAGSAIPLPAPDVTVVAVKLSVAPGFDGQLMTNYEVTPDGDLLLRSARFWPGFGSGFAGQGDGGQVGPFAVFQDYDLPYGGLPTRVWPKIEVFYIGNGVIPRAVAEGTAFLTAGYYQDGPRALGGFFKEKIGDYEYQRDSMRGGSIPEYVETAMRFLSPFFKGSRVAVT